MSCIKSTPACTTQDFPMLTSPHTHAQSLRQLLFGTSKGPSFSQEWRRQNFEFSDIPGLEYGLVQHKVGHPIIMLRFVMNKLFSPLYKYFVWEIAPNFYVYIVYASCMCPPLIMYILLYPPPPLL